MLADKGYINICLLKISKNISLVTRTGGVSVSKSVHGAYFEAAGGYCEHNA
jgi:hypothetical protein